ncbi:ParB/RepB/Spo0J family partition protein [Bacteroidales bacterium OttesenSCG-928-B11]|nr:ParB/RepB/Spo0J family partition protein [Bacteroidales bacterium OttesenSCG-928-E04]MDL2309086.1 ParB/RepB/Spo0J family partition protein [Bacteroidales bacterium OttesenSCG-928-C03]MDL2312195.1 ParB/RepB/Spo0J family partition protein [Bacteroidales bacterium OttesenSCG-928-B11]MDL2326237.1 ParB/RepB/Spo0J family partition protein [Bacteroidales bacterium OttesenSCG-928-A14]
MEKNKKGSSLGKGLGAIFGDDLELLSAGSAARVKTDNNTTIKIASIDVNPYQPRTQFEEEALKELADSIKTYGLIQPITVRPIENGRYQLISGERRLRASQLVGMTDIPAYVRTVDDMLSIQMALVENIQREDLNAIEIAVSYQRLIDECNITQEELSAKIGKKRSTIANYLRLLKLSRDAQIAIRDNLISMGHARAIVALEDDELQATVVRKVVDDSLSVRQTEALVKKYSADFKKPKTKIKITLSDDIRNFQTSLSKKLNSKVNIQKDISGKGKITIPFASDDEMKKIIEIFDTILPE